MPVVASRPDASPLGSPTPETPTATYTVGYCKPPQATQFKPGQSGNPSGRKRRQKTSIETLNDELARTIVTREGDKTSRITRMTAIIRRFIQKLLVGDGTAHRLFFGLLPQLDATLLSERERPVPSTAAQLAAEDEAILQMLEAELLNISRPTS